MTPERQRIAIAELCGWFFSDRHWHMPNGAQATADGGPDLPPDYLNDLNAMHEAQLILTYAQKCEMSAWIEMMNCAGYGPQLFATAAQRAEAFLRTLNKWEEST